MDFIDQWRGFISKNFERSLCFIDQAANANNDVSNSYSYDG
jgi:hypothetical protein